MTTPCTPYLSLPYLGGDERLCDGPPVWLSMEEKIKTLLGEIDDGLAVTAISIPMARVAQLEPVTFASFESSRVTWDSVIADTDNMVNLDIDADAVYLRRAGIWGVEANAQVSNAGSTDERINQNMSLPFTVVVTSRHWGSVPSSVPAFSDQVQVGLPTWRFFVLTQAAIDAAGPYRLTVDSGDIINGTATRWKAEMSVRWYAEVS